MTGRPPPWFALVESNTTGSGRQFCAAARGHGMRPVLLAAVPERYPYLAVDGVDVRHVDTTDVATVVAACQQLEQDDGGLAGVTSSSEYFVAAAAEVAAKLGLPAPDTFAISMCRQKDRQREILAAADIAQPRFRTAGLVDEAVRAARRIGFPVVVKPTAGTGSAGVRLCHDASEVARHAGALLAGKVDARLTVNSGLVLVEEYVAGHEVSVETFDGAAIAVVDKHLGPEPYFVETGHDIPSTLAPPLLAEVCELATRAVRALAIDWGAAHTEVRIGVRGARVVEVNPRLAGGMIPTLVDLAKGVDLVDAVVARAGGRRPAPTVRGDAHASIRFVLAPAPGTVAEVTGVEEARSRPGVSAVHLTCEPGTVVDVTGSYRDRVGYVIATGDSAGARAAEAAALVQVALREDPT